jgi:hypothetical protein
MNLRRTQNCLQEETGKSLAAVGRVHGNVEDFCFRANLPPLKDGQHFPANLVNVNPAGGCLVCGGA